jgi:hypothetical protein
VLTSGNHGVPAEAPDRANYELEITHAQARAIVMVDARSTIAASPHANILASRRRKSPTLHNRGHLTRDISRGRSYGMKRPVAPLTKKKPAHDQERLNLHRNFRPFARIDHFDVCQGYLTTRASAIEVA